MNFWNFIGEFFLFRWLFSKISKLNRTQQDNRTNIITDSQCINDATTTSLMTEGQNNPAEAVETEDQNSLAGSDVPENLNSAAESDAAEMEEKLDDLDIYMRNNPYKEYRSSNYDFGRYSDVDSDYRDDQDDDYDRDDYDLDDYDRDDNFGRLFDDFLDEQDDYNIMDDL